MNVAEYNKKVWDKYVADKVRWTIPVSKDDIGGQLSAGFFMTDFYEDYWGDGRVIDKYFPSFFATRAIKG